MQAALAAVEAVRCAGITVGIIPPQIVSANVAMTLGSIVRQPITPTDVTAATNCAAGGLRQRAAGWVRLLPLSRLAQVAYDASPNIANVTGVTLNGGTADLERHHHPGRQGRHAGGGLRWRSGDQADISRRIFRWLPARWFPTDQGTLVQAVVNGLATGLASIYSMIAYAALQVRIATATDGFLGT